MPPFGGIFFDFCHSVHGGFSQNERRFSMQTIWKFITLFYAGLTWVISVV